MFFDRYQLLKDMSQVLDGSFPQFVDIDAEEVSNQPLVEKPDSPIRLQTATMTAAAASASGLVTPAPVLKPFVLSYGPAHLQTSTNVRLQKIKNKFTEIDFQQRATPDRSASRQPGHERRRMLMSVMNRAASGRSTAASRARTVTAAAAASSSPSKSRLSLSSSKHLQSYVSMRADGTLSPSKSVSVSRPTSTMSKTCSLQ